MLLASNRVSSRNMMDKCELVILVCSHRKSGCFAVPELTALKLVHKGRSAFFVACKNESTDGAKLNTAGSYSFRLARYRVFSQCCRSHFLCNIRKRILHFFDMPRSYFARCCTKRWNLSFRYRLKHLCTCEAGSTGFYFQPMRTVEGSKMPVWSCSLQQKSCLRQSRICTIEGGASSVSVRKRAQFCQKSASDFLKGHMQVVQAVGSNNMPFQACMTTVFSFGNA